MACRSGGSRRPLSDTVTVLVLLEGLEAGRVRVGKPCTFCAETILLHYYAKVGVIMQKPPGIERTWAIGLLRAALPTQVEVANQSASLEIRGPSTGSLTVQMVASERDPATGGALPVVILEGAGRTEHDRLRRAGSSFVDLSGVVCLQAPGLYIDRTDLAPMKLDRSPSGGVDPYSDKASRVVRVLLMNPRARRWNNSGLAAEAEVDVSTASRVARELRRRDLVLDEAPGQGRSSRIGVKDPAALLRDWARRYSWTDNRQLRVAAPVGSVRRFISRMGNLFEGRRWALSLRAGASLLAPHAEFDLIHTYVDVSPELFALEKGWEPSPSGRLVLLQPAYGESVWFQAQRLHAANVVSRVQLVLDLWHYPVRGREQAEHIIETILEPMWAADVQSQ